MSDRHARAKSDADGDWRKGWVGNLIPAHHQVKRYLRLYQTAQTTHHHCKERLNVRASVSLMDEGEIVMMKADTLVVVLSWQMGT